jgi:hypothetical protein
MKNFTIYIAVMVILMTSNMLGQVLIGGSADSGENPHSSAMLHMKNPNEAAASAMGLPIANNATELPFYDASQPDLYQDYPNYEGMLMYQLDQKEVKLYDGQKWSNAFSVESPNLTRARVASNYTVPSSGGPLNFTYFNDKANGFVDYMNLKTGVTAANIFKIRQTGVYRINIILELSLSNTNLLATAYVNNAYRFALKFDIRTGGSSRVANYEFTMLLKQGEEVKFDVSSENSQGFTIYGTNLSNIMFEKIL